jgi:hypothetical protein
MKQVIALASRSQRTAVAGRPAAQDGVGVARSSRDLMVGTIASLEGDASV